MFSIRIYLLEIDLVLNHSEKSYVNYFDIDYLKFNCENPLKGKIRLKIQFL